MAEQSTDGGFWDGLQDRVFQSLDYLIAEEWGGAMGYDGGYWPTGYVESTPPTNANPVEPGFTFGNNPVTWGAGALLLVGGFLLYKAIK